MITKDELNQMDYVHYACGSYAYFDGYNYYNDSGQQLRNPGEYNPYSEGYTPFGDE